MILAAPWRVIVAVFAAATPDSVFCGSFRGAHSRRSSSSGLSRSLRSMVLTACRFADLTNLEAYNTLAGSLNDA